MKILIIDDIDSNLYIYGKIARRIAGDNNVTASKYFLPEFLNQHWDLIIIDVNSDENGKHGKEVKKEILQKKPELKGKVFLMSSAEHFSEYFIHKENFIDFVKEKFNNFTK